MWKQHERGAPAPLLVLATLDKRFGATHALKTVDLELEAGMAPVMSAQTVNQAQAAEYSGYAGPFRCFFGEKILKTVCFN